MRKGCGLLLLPLSLAILQKGVDGIDENGQEVAHQHEPQSSWIHNLLGLNSKRTKPPDGNTFFAIRGKKSSSGDFWDTKEKKHFIKPNGLFQSIPKRSLKPNSLFGIHGKRTLKPNSLFGIPGKRVLKPNSLFGISGKRMLKPNSLFGSYGKRALKPNSLFTTYGKRIMKPNSLFGYYGKRVLKPNTLFGTFEKRSMNSMKPNGIFGMRKLRNIPFANEENVSECPHEYLPCSMDLSGWGSPNGFYGKYKRGTMKPNGLFSIPKRNVQFNPSEMDIEDANEEDVLYSDDEDEEDTQEEEDNEYFTNEIDYYNEHLDKKSDPDFWAARGKKMDNSDFWATRGKRDKDGGAIDFWAARGKRELDDEADEEN